MPSLPTNGKPTVVITATAKQDFHEAGHGSIVEAMLLLKAGGAVATIAPSGLSTLAGGFDFLRRFEEELLGEPSPTLGKALLATKRTMLPGGGGGLDRQASRFTLLGDPAMRFP